MAQSRVRIGGSGYTVMTWRGNTLAYLQNINDQAPQAVRPAEEVQPIDEPHPIEIVTAQAVRGGTISLVFYELWNTPVWASLPGLEGTATLLDVLRRQLSLGEITCQKVIKNPNGSYRVRVYHGCVIEDIDENERVEIGTMTLPKTIRMKYTHVTQV